MKAEATASLMQIKFRRARPRSKSRLLWPSVQAGDVAIDDGAAILDNADNDAQPLDAQSRGCWQG